MTTTTTTTTAPTPVHVAPQSSKTLRALLCFFPMTKQRIMPNASRIQTQESSRALPHIVTPSVEQRASTGESYERSKSTDCERSAMAAVAAAVSDGGLARGRGRPWCLPSSEPPAQQKKVATRHAEEQRGAVYGGVYADFLSFFRIRDWGLLRILCITTAAAAAG